jgi:hypothetical protein
VTLLVSPPLSPAAALRELGRLRRALDHLDLDGRARREANDALTAAARELAAECPDARRVAGQLARVTTVLRRAGALDDPGDALSHSLGRLRIWLGPLPF